MDIEEIKRLAEASKFKLSEEELLDLEKDFKKIIEEFKIIEEINVDNIEPLFNPLEDIVVNRFGKDEVIKFEDIEKIYDEEKMVDNFYQVPNKEGN